MPHFQLPLAVAALALVAAVPSVHAAYYKYDDGQTDTALGPPSSFSSNPQTGWGNVFTAVGGSDNISAVQIAFGPTWPTRGVVNVHIFQDADNDFDPRTNTTLLASTSGTPAQIGLSIFNTFSFASPVAVTGNFFVLATTNTVKGQDRMAAQDVSAGAPTNRSWLIYNPVNVGVNLTNLASNAYIQPAANATLIDGVFMIRAVPEPTTLASLSLAGLLVRRRR